MTRAQIAERAERAKRAKAAKLAERYAENRRRALEGDELVHRLVGERLERERAALGPPETPDTRTDLEKRFNAIGEEVRRS